jgi:hypothetical protein
LFAGQPHTVILSGRYVSDWTVHGPDSNQLLSSSFPNLQLYSILSCCQDVVVPFETPLPLPRRTQPRRRLVQSMETELYNGQTYLDIIERLLYNLSRMGNGGAWPTSLEQTLSYQPLDREWRSSAALLFVGDLWPHLALCRMKSHAWSLHCSPTHSALRAVNDLTGGISIHEDRHFRG